MGANWGYGWGTGFGAPFSVFFFIFWVGLLALIILGVVRLWQLIQKDKKK